MGKKTGKRYSCNGMWGTRFYGVWKNMRQRSRPNRKQNLTSNSRCYRDIRMCPEWQEFMNFFHDMYSSYLQHVEKYGEKQTTIDRIDGAKGYYKENCRWSTPAEQTRNRKNVVIYSFKGKKMNLKEWADYLGMYRSVLQRRLEKGWPIEHLLNKKKYKGIRPLPFKKQ